MPGRRDRLGREEDARMTQAGAAHGAGLADDEHQPNLAAQAEMLPLGRIGGLDDLLDAWLRVRFRDREMPLRHGRVEDLRARRPHLP